MKWRIYKLILFLLLGAIINVALIYGVLLRLDYPDGHWITLTSSAQLPWPEAMPNDPGVVRIVSISTFGTDLFLCDNSGKTFGKLSRAGFPLRSVEGGAYINPNMDRAVEVGGIVLWQDWQRKQWSAGVLPLRPIWSGFAINTVFYGAIVWTLLTVQRTLRRRRRTKRRLCPACAYPIGASIVCTECGEGAKL